MGLDVQELPKIIGISRRTLFSARNTDRGVTAKTWLKLEAAERTAGIGHGSPLKEGVTTPKTAEKISDLNLSEVDKPSGFEKSRADDDLRKVLLAEQRLDRLEIRMGQMEDLLHRVVELLEHPKDRLKKSS